MIIPPLAVLLVSGGLIVLGIIYAAFIYRIHKTQDELAKNVGPDVYYDTQTYWEPNFRNVTYYVRKKGVHLNDDDWFQN